MKISIIIPNYNGEKILAKNITRLIDIVKNDTDKFEIQIFIIDDASTDGSVSIIKKVISQILTKKYHLDIILMVNEQNLGFAKTVNKGVKESKGDIVILLNTDVIPKNRFIEKTTLHFKNDSNLFAVGYMDECREQDGSVIFRGRGIARWSRGFFVHSRGNTDKSNTLWANGGSSAFRKSIWDKLGGMNTLYTPFYYEDIDISYRALKAGYNIYFDKNLVFIHEHEKGSIKSNYSKREYKKIAYRNSMLFILLNIFDLTQLLLFFIWLPYHMVKTYPRDDWIFISALGDVMSKAGDIINYRRINRKMFLYSDKYILNKFKS